MYKAEVSASAFFISLHYPVSCLFISFRYIFILVLYVQMLYIVRMEKERIEIRADKDFIKKVDYLKEINNYRSRSDTIRKTIEKELARENLKLPKKFYYEDGNMYLEDE